MTKFFAQFLLSVMIGVSAAAGFNSNARGTLKETVHAARIVIRETAHTAFETVGDLFTQTDVNLDAAVDVASKGTANSSSTNAQLTGTGNLDLVAAPALSVDGSLAADARINAEAETENVDLSLSEKLKSTLGLTFGFGN
jgi:hypothetical protein